MARKKEGLIILLTELPWWVSVIVAGVVYVGMRWILPSMEFSNPMLRSLAAATPNVAWIFGLLFLFPALISFFKGKLTSMDRVKAPAPANGAALNVSTGAQSSPKTPCQAELLGAPQGEKGKRLSLVFPQLPRPAAREPRPCLSFPFDLYPFSGLGPCAPKPPA